MKYTQIPTDTFEQIQLNAGILVDNFNPATGVVGNLLGATSGGVNFTDTVTFKDFGEDIDNCPKNMKELKVLDQHEVKLSGTFVTVTASSAKLLAGAADVDSNDSSHIIPRNDVLQSDFKNLWWIGDYSDVNTGSNAGFIAIKLINALNTGGFQIQSTDKEKGKFAFEFTGHYSMSAQDTVPYEIYVKNGSSGTEVPSISLNNHYIEVAAEGSETLTATVKNSSSSVSWSAATSVVTVSNGVVTAGSSAGNTIVTASITDNGVTYSDTCTVVVKE